MSAAGGPPPGLKVFGPDTTCNLDTCPVEWSLYGFRPSLAANVAFLALFAVMGLVHTWLGIKWRTWGFMTGMILGCLCELVGYVGRIMLWKDPFSFNGFMTQIICLTIAPVFYTASIYVTLYKAINYFAPDLSRFHPKLFYWIFIPFDLVCLCLQAAGGAMSTDSSGSNKAGENISMAGLALQVVILTAFIAAFADYMFRYWRSGRLMGFGGRIGIFFFGLTASTLLILVRCAYRVAELRDGYNGTLIKEEIPFIVLEGVVIVLAGFALCLGHPGLVFDREMPRKVSRDSESDLPAYGRK
ncbi:hypothetical protein HIM_07705 [Hirsutella minnesotensis 3608]|uniref:Sphingoid long-chain base transporter RSB1 n=1 Tax=Hirsutella minnesotensis 3608 TaxID=1043627 RepID=A0A0F7ZYR7_9HYPO|nr:hypothetical protein HIM_07705 [Hirsutella minnesotensis 3608]